jgi:hypothetical protein
MSSYVLFTLDKLVQKVVKQMQLVLQEEQSHRLVELWKYEDARTAPVRAARPWGRGQGPRPRQAARRPRLGGRALPLAPACTLTFDPSEAPWPPDHRTPHTCSPFLPQVHDAVYHANAHVLLQGDACFRFEHLASRSLTVQLLDADKMDAPPGGREGGPAGWLSAAWLPALGA